MSESASLDITEDLTREQLAAVAFGVEVVVSWMANDDKHYGVIVGYEDNTKSFEIDPVHKDERGEWVDSVPHHHLTMEDFGGDGWRRRSLLLKRSDFVVFGPADRDPGDKPVEVQSSIEPGAELRGFDTLGHISPDPRLDAFVDAVREILTVGMGDFCSNEPTFKVRLDIDARAAKAHEPEGGPAYPRKYRILVRPVMAPIMHDELVALLRIAEQYELAAIHGQHGIELRQPDDMVD